MSIVPKETIEVIAQSIGISNLSSEVALALAPDVEYRLREIMQEAIKCMRHSKRTVLTAEDVDSALSMRNIEPIYGFASGDPLRFKKAVGHKDLFYLDDREVDFKDIINAPLPKAPLDTSVVAHWLAIEGVQPAVPENIPIDALSKTKRPEHNKEDGLPVDLKLPVKHVLSRELQLYLDKITELAVGKPETILFEKALSSLATDSGLNPLVPYFSFFIADQVPRSLNDLPVLFALMRMVRSLLRNPHLHIENYLHQFMPSMLTCIVAKRLGQRIADNHWELRDFSVHLVALVCKRFGNMYHNLQTRLTKTLVHAFLDPSKAMTQHYGAIQGLSAFGPTVVRLLILPNLETYLQLLEPEMLLEKQKNEMKRKEAWRVYGALLCAAGNCLHDMLKAFPVALTQPKQTVLKTKGKIVTTIPNKRKADSNSTFQEPALKKHRASASTSGGGPTTPSCQMSNTSNDSAVTTGSARDKNAKVTANNNKTRNPLAQAWKEDVDAGKLLSSLFELFGERILAFVQPPEMSLFI